MVGRTRIVGVTEDMTSTDPVDLAVAAAIEDVMAGASVSIDIAPCLEPDVEGADAAAVGTATGAGGSGDDVTITVRLRGRIASLARDGTSLAELVRVLPGAGLRTAAKVRGVADVESPAMRRAVRDTLAAEILSDYFTSRLGSAAPPGLLDDILDYLIEVSGTRVEAHEVTHGVVLANAISDEPRLALHYPRDLRAAKRAPLLFDGQRSVLVVDRTGRARTELQQHRLDRLGGSDDDTGREGWLESGSLVARATRRVGGIGFFVRSDRSIWAFVEGQPVLVRRGEHWTAFPVELAASISDLIGGGHAAALVARAAYMISTRPQGAIFAIVDDPSVLPGYVAAKDRFDLRHEIDVDAMRPETRLHHLLDVDEVDRVDEHTLARLAALDGATVVDRDGRLLAYGAIVTTADSEHEGARTAAARTLSSAASVVLKVSVDGDITVFRDGVALTTLLGRPHATEPGAVEGDSGGV